MQHFVKDSYYWNLKEGDRVEYTVLRGRRPHRTTRKGTVVVNPTTNELVIKIDINGQLAKFYNGIVDLKILKGE